MLLYIYCLLHVIISNDYISLMSTITSYIEYLMDRIFKNSLNYYLSICVVILVLYWNLTEQDLQEQILVWFVRDHFLGYHV